MERGESRAGFLLPLRVRDVLAAALIGPGVEMSNLVARTIDGQVLTLTLSHPPVNALSFPLRDELARQLIDAFNDSEIRAIVLSGGSKLFCAGAEISEFGTPLAFRTPNLASLIALLDDAPKPVIAAINGSALGGGFELALACHYRIASRDAEVAFPEIHLGFIPGAQGTQRLPRLLGIERALNVMLSGGKMKASDFADTSLFDRLVEGDAAAAAQGFARELSEAGAPVPRVRDLPIGDASAEAFLLFARNMVAPFAKHNPAAERLIDAVAAALTSSFDDGAEKEKAIFQALVDSPQSRALRHAFFAERRVAKIEGLPAGTAPRPVHRVAVIGAGTMGAGIAQVFLMAGFPVILVDMNAAALERGVATIGKTLEAGVKRGRVAREIVESLRQRLTPSTDLASIADCDLAIEAVFEDMVVKTAIFKQLDVVLRPGAIIASNTSTLDLDRLAEITNRPHDVIGLHFFSPAHVMKLLEIVRGEKTSDDVLATAMDLARRIRKVPVLSRVCDGFIGNRMINAYLDQAMLLIEEGAMPDAVDRALEDWGMAMGPFRMGDLTGNDIGWAIRKRQYAENPARHRALIADRLCELGRFGQKTGLGWYRYPPGSRSGLPDPVVASLIESVRIERGIAPCRIKPQEIVQRCIYALANEGARLLAEGIAQRASDIDVVYLAGYGFPRHRGGPMHVVEEIGPGDVVHTMEAFSRRGGPDAEFWNPAGLLIKAARTGKSLLQFERGGV